MALKEITQTEGMFHGQHPAQTTWVPRRCVCMPSSLTFDWAFVLIGSLCDCWHWRKFLNELSGPSSRRATVDVKDKLRGVFWGTAIMTKVQPCGLFASVCKRRCIEDRIAFLYVVLLGCREKSKALKSCTFLIAGRTLFSFCFCHQNIWMGCHK